ncbi:hypothetical protein D3C87_1415450 [compost metagenome]
MEPTLYVFSKNEGGLLQKFKKFGICWFFKSTFFVLCSERDKFFIDLISLAKEAQAIGLPSCLFSQDVLLLKQIGLFVDCFQLRIDNLLVLCELIPGFSQFLSLREDCRYEPDECQRGKKSGKKVTNFVQVW